MHSKLEVRFVSKEQPAAIVAFPEYDKCSVIDLQPEAAAIVEGATHSGRMGVTLFAIMPGTEKNPRKVLAAAWITGDMIISLAEQVKKFKERVNEI